MIEETIIKLLDGKYDYNTLEYFDLDSTERDIIARAIVNQFFWKMKIDFGYKDFYLEYIEQINNLTTTPIDNGLNHKDAVLFVYNRILTEYIENGKKTDKDQANNTTDISNQLTVIEQSSIQEIINLTSCISSWNNTKLSTFEQQCICNRFLRQYLNLLIEPLNENEPKINTVIMCKIMETIFFV